MSEAPPAPTKDDGHLKRKAAAGAVWTVLGMGGGNIVRLLSSLVLTRLLLEEHFGLIALVLAAIGFRDLSMRPAAIGPVKRALLEADLGELRAVMERADSAGATSARAGLRAWAEKTGLPV